VTRPQAVVFDLFETLVTEFDPSWQAKPSTAERLGVEVEAFERGWRARHHERMTRPLDFRDVLRDICPTGQGDVIEALYIERLESKATPLLEVEQAVLDMLVQLDSAGLRLGLISNCSVEEVAVWERSPLAALFDEVVFSFQVGLVKPDQAIYKLACSRLGVSPADAAFVGDGGSDELAGAAASGMRPYCAGWFLERWPTERSRGAAGFPWLRTPAEVLGALV
jgi:HAD superfamily hydrolase (TIGR01549 family)